MGVLPRKSQLFGRKSSRDVEAIQVEVDYVVQRSPFLLAAENRTSTTTTTSSSASLSSSSSSASPPPAACCAQHEVNNVARGTLHASMMVATFRRKEYQIGELLGSGSFSSVHTITGYKLSTNKKRNKLQKQQQHQLLQTQQSFGSSNSSLAALAAAIAASEEEAQEQARVALTQDSFDEEGNARFAVKFVRKELSKKPNINGDAFRNAAADLVVEAKYLAALNHKNLIKIRGMAQDGTKGFLDGHDGFFIIVDRLEETLADRIERWKQEEQDFSKTLLRLSASSSDAELEAMKRQRNHDLLTLQADYALQTADAIGYLHSHRIIWRDVKPSNIGFKANDRHVVQIFDLGLCRELPECNNPRCGGTSTHQGGFCSSSRTSPGGDAEDAHHEHYPDDDTVMFHMSGAGTYSYMAVEILNTKRYNLKADVYSWAFLVHEMITLQRPFEHYTFAEHKEFVCEIGQRPPLEDLAIPPTLKNLLRQAWEQDPTQRLTMKQVVGKLNPIHQELMLANQKMHPPKEVEALGVGAHQLSCTSAAEGALKKAAATAKPQQMKRQLSMGRRLLSSARASSRAIIDVGDLDVEDGSSPAAHSWPMDEKTMKEAPLKRKGWAVRFDFGKKKSEETQEEEVIDAEVHPVLAQQPPPSPQKSLASVSSTDHEDDEAQQESEEIIDAEVHRVAPPRQQQRQNCGNHAQNLVHQPQPLRQRSLPPPTHRQRAAEPTLSFSAPVSSSSSIDEDKKKDAPMSFQLSAGICIGLPANDDGPVNFVPANDRPVNFPDRPVNFAIGLPVID